MNRTDRPRERSDPATLPLHTSQSIDWYSEGQTRTVEAGGVRITVRFIGRKGRRGRIAIEAPAGAVFAASDGYENPGGRRPGPA